MASGVKVDDTVIAKFQLMKLHKSLEDKKKRPKAIIFCLSKDMKSIVIEEGKEMLAGDCEEGDAYQHFVTMLPLDDCRYALFDCSYETKECKKQDLVFILWAPESAPLKSKMIYASSKDALKKKFPGIKFEWQANCPSEIKDRCCLAEKLGAAVTVVEGMRIS